MITYEEFKKAEEIGAISFEFSARVQSEIRGLEAALGNCSDDLNRAMTGWASPWTPVSEELPNEQLVLVAFDRVGYRKPGMTLGWYDKRRGWRSHFGWQKLEHVTHWMPLPEVPNE